ncbi:MAG: hypothetical protein JST85_08060 [Acidobacteria bacterium]|nr:hypothetical protein [Acidobacteriota bacterium]
MKQTVLFVVILVCLVSVCRAQTVQGKVVDFVSKIGVPEVKAQASLMCTNPFGQMFTLSSEAMTDADGKFTVSYPLASGSSCQNRSQSFSLSKVGFSFVDRKVVDGNTNFWAISETVPRWAQVSAASYAPATTSEMIVAGFGGGLSDATELAVTDPLPTQLAGRTVKITDYAGAEKPAQLFFVSPTQVNLLLPAGLEPGSAIVELDGDAGLLKLGVVTVQKVSPGIFTADASGSGLAAAVIVRVFTDGRQQYEPIALYDGVQQRWLPIPIEFTPDTARIVLALFGTGWRQVASANDVTVDFVATSERNDPQPKRLTTAEYAGKQPTLAGVDQINVEIPRSLIGKGETDVLVTMKANPSTGFDFKANRVQIFVK